MSKIIANHFNAMLKAMNADLPKVSDIVKAPLYVNLQATDKTNREIDAEVTVSLHKHFGW